MMELTSEERAMLAGECGSGVRQAMEIVVALGRIYGARRLTPVVSAQIAGVSYRNLGDAGLEFLSAWAATEARTRIPTTLNPAGMDLQAWEEMGFSPSFAHRQLAVIQAYRRLGARTTCTCAPYLLGNSPAPGEHVAWAESSAVSYANSALGARTNREGGPSALAAAITGRTAAYGLHLDENRRAALRVIVRCAVHTPADFGALGWLVGKVARSRVVYFEGLEELPIIAEGCQRGLQALGAALAASGAVALYHVAGVTPEAACPGILAPDHETIVVDDLRPAYAGLNTTDERAIDLAWFGCPHAGLEEIAEVARLLDGRRARAALWITTAREVRDRAAAAGLVRAIEDSGGRVVADMCAVVTPLRELGFHSVATPSGKGASYLPSHAGLRVRYGTPAQCVEAAVSGLWPESH